MKMPDGDTATARQIANIGKRIHQLRINRHMTQAGMPVSHAMMSRYENGDTTPSLGHLERLCERFGISLKQFFADEMHDMFIWEVVPLVKLLRPAQRLHILKVMAAAPKQE
jgi:transcriptional regulator with XRE-family HTH domain